jgi:hypothetical protein
VQDVGEQLQRVGVGPLQIIDRQDERAQLAEARVQAAQRRERARAQLLRVRQLGRVPAGAAHGRQLRQRREQARDQAGLGAEDERGVGGIEAAHVAREHLHRAVERLVRHRLALVAAAGEHGQARQVVREVLDEVARQGALAHARLADDGHAHGVAARVLEGLRERAQLRAAADERRGLVGRRRRRCAQRGVGGRA